MSTTIPAGTPPLSLITESRLFMPFYSPQDMLKMGVYGGAFFGAGNALSLLPMLGSVITNDLFKGVPQDKYLNNTYDPTANYFNLTLPKSDRSFTMPVYLKRMHTYGWFEWYVRYYYGERNKADTWRIRQWQHSISVDWYYIETTGGPSKYADLTFLQTRRQKLLEKGWDPTIPPAQYNLKVKF